MLVDFRMHQQLLIKKWNKALECCRMLEYVQATDLIEQEIQKLENSEFYLMVVGHFKRGKSTLINYLVGKEILPTGVVPITSVITKIKFGDQAKATVFFKDDTAEIIDIEDIGLFVSEEKNPGNEKRVKLIEVLFPSQNLKNGLVLLDTPGIGSVFAHNTEAAHEYLPRADAAIFVISSDPPISELEVEFLREVKKYADRVFIVQNKIDYLVEEDVETTLNFSRKIIGDKLQERVHIFPISAINALQGLKENDRDKLLGSRMPEFEDALNNFLTKEKGEVLLSSSENKLDRLLRNFLSYIDFKISGLKMPAVELEKKLKEFSAGRKELSYQQEETLHLVGNYINNIIKDIDRHVNKLVSDNLPGIMEELESIFESNNSKSPGDLARLLQESLEDRVKTIYSDFNRNEEKFVNEEFAKLMRRFTDRLNTSIDYVNSISQQIFGINLSQHIDSVELVDKRVFYFKFGSTSSSMLIPSKVDIARFMPRKIGNRMVFNSIAGRVEEELKKNGANLKWEYICKLRDSRFIFEGIFKERIIELIGQAEKMIEKMVFERDKVKGSVEGLINKHESIKWEVEKLLTN